MAKLREREGRQTPGHELLKKLAQAVTSLHQQASNQHKPTKMARQHASTNITLWLLGICLLALVLLLARQRSVSASLPDNGQAGMHLVWESLSNQFLPNVQY